MFRCADTGVKWYLVLVLNLKMNVQFVSAFKRILTWVHRRIVVKNFGGKCGLTRILYELAKLKGGHYHVTASVVLPRTGLHIICNCCQN